MHKKLLFVLVIVMPIMAFIAIPGAGAACGDAPGFGVDWSGCDKSGEDLSGAVMGFMILNGTNFTNANLSGANMAFVNAANADFTNADLTGASLNTANLSNALFNNATVTGVDMRATTVVLADFSGADLTTSDMTNATNFNDVSFVGANIPGLNLGNTTIARADFSGSAGSPLLGGTDINDSICPNGTDSRASSPFCNWVPTAVSLSGMSAAVMANPWPLVLFALLLAGTAGIFVGRRNREPQEVTA